MKHGVLFLTLALLLADLAVSRRGCDWPAVSLAIVACSSFN